MCLPRVCYSRFLVFGCFTCMKQPFVASFVQTFLLSSLPRVFRFDSLLGGPLIRERSSGFVVVSFAFMPSYFGRILKHPSISTPLSCCFSAMVDAASLMHAVWPCHSWFDNSISLTWWRIFRMRPHLGGLSAFFIRIRDWIVWQTGLRYQSSLKLCWLRIPEHACLFGKSCTTTGACDAPFQTLHHVSITHVQWQRIEKILIRQVLSRTAVWAEISLRSPRKIFIFIINKNIYRMEVSKNRFI